MSTESASQPLSFDDAWKHHDQISQERYVALLHQAATTDHLDNDHFRCLRDLAGIFCFDPETVRQHVAYIRVAGAGQQAQLTKAYNDALRARQAKEKEFNEALIEARNLMNAVEPGPERARRAEQLTAVQQREREAVAPFKQAEKAAERKVEESRADKERVEQVAHAFPGWFVSRVADLAANNAE